jgi:hypothetical protein
MDLFIQHSKSKDGTKQGLQRDIDMEGIQWGPFHSMGWQDALLCSRKM